MSDKEDYDLSSLPSYIFYDRLDRALYDYSYENEAFWKHIKDTCIKETSIFDALLKGFYYVSYYKITTNSFYNDRWDYLYFWAGSKVIKNEKGCSFEDIMHVLKSVKIRNDNQTEYSYDIFKINSKDFQDLKTVYDYFNNYESIKLKILSNNNDCTKEYKQYLLSSFPVYERVKSDCQNKAGEAHCKLFNYIEEKHSKKILTELTCKGEMPSLSVEQHKQKYLQYSDVEGDLEKEIQIGETAPSSSSDNMMSTYFPFLGIFSFLFLLYNFSPFRSWLDNIVSKKEIIRHPLYEEGDEFFEREYESPDKNREYNRHDVSYNSIINT
ncbi:PIR Superfamily Protein [Plasmodium ovale curtisi]|uniref:PIR Superfamily Protein n=1 Tax=Plasmodium ovale curtisi TaxID=864141 RepID=A0A1A8WCW5_PLAOA|nr:PIR Superfamily Protein [Plasmodium ovale curtisi]